MLSTITASSSTGLVPVVANDVYTVAGNGTSGNTFSTQASSSTLDAPEATLNDSLGNLYIATDGDVVEELAATTGTQWGIAMMAGNLYRIAGTAGTAGTSGDGKAATSADLSKPDGRAFDASGESRHDDNPGPDNR